MKKPNILWIMKTRLHSSFFNNIIKACNKLNILILHDNDKKLSKYVFSLPDWFNDKHTIIHIIKTKLYTSPINTMLFLFKHKTLFKKIDLIATDSIGLSGMAAVFSKWILRKPLVIKVGILPYEYFYWSNFKRNKIITEIKWFFNRKIITTVLKNSDAVIADNKLIASNLLKYNKKLKFYFSLPYGIDMIKFHPVKDLAEKKTLREKYNLPYDKKIIVFIGRISGEKGGVLPLIKSIKLLNKKFADLFLLIIGKKDINLWPTKECEEFLQKNKITNVEIRSQVLHNDAAEIMRSCDVYIQPSFSEGHGIAPLEAMSCKIPVIATDVGGLKLNVMDGKTGFVIKKIFDEAEYSSVIQRVLNSRNNFKMQVINNAYNLVKSKYKADVVQNKLIDIFHDIMKLFPLKVI